MIDDEKLKVLDESLNDGWEIPDACLIAKITKDEFVEYCGLNQNFRFS